MLNYSRNANKHNVTGDQQANDPSLIENFIMNPYHANGPTVHTQGDAGGAGFYGYYENYYKINGDFTEQGMLNGGDYTKYNVYGNDSASVYQGPSFNVIGQGKTESKVSNAPKPVKENAAGADHSDQGYLYLNASSMATVRENDHGEGYMNAGGVKIGAFFSSLFPNRQGSLDAKNAQKLADANLTNAEAQALMQPQAPQKFNALPLIIGGSVLAAAGVIALIVYKHKHKK